MMLERHNISRLRERAAEAFPHLTLAQVETLPFAERKAAGVVLPYEIATLPFPYGFEQSHIMLVGTNGTGKTTALRRLVATKIDRRDGSWVFDITCTVLRSFNREVRDHERKTTRRLTGRGLG